MLTGTSLTPNIKSQEPLRGNPKDGNLISWHGQKSTYRHGLEPNSG